MDAMYMYKFMNAGQRMLFRPTPPCAGMPASKQAIAMPSTPHVTACPPPPTCTPLPQLAVTVAAALGGLVWTMASAEQPSLGVLGSAIALLASRAAQVRVWWAGGAARK